MRVLGRRLVVLMEMTLENLLSEGQLNHADFLARVDILGALGRTVMISKFGEYFRLASYLSRYTNRMIGLVMGVPSLLEIFDEKYYLNLEGGILEALGRMFKSGLKLYVYPMIDEETGELVTATKLEVAPNLRSLYRYLIDNEFIQEITDYNPEYLRIHPAGRAREIAVGRPGLGTDGPAGSGADDQRARRFFGYRALCRRIRQICPAGFLPATQKLSQAENRGCRHGSRYRNGSTMARRGNSVIGIDLGKHVFKGVLLQRKGDERFVLTSYASREVPEEITTAGGARAAAQALVQRSRRQRQGLRHRGFRSRHRFSESSNSRIRQSICCAMPFASTASLS